jgi:hypothetical protein
MAEKVEARILAHSASVGAGLVKEVSNVQTQEVVRSLTPFAEEFLVELRWRVSEEDNKFTLKIQCATYDAVSEEIANSGVDGKLSKYAAIWMTLGTFALLAPAQFAFH